MAERARAKAVGNREGLSTRVSTSSLPIFATFPTSEREAASEGRMELAGEDMPWRGSMRRSSYWESNNQSINKISQTQTLTKIPLPPLPTLALWSPLPVKGEGKTGLDRTQESDWRPRCVQWSRSPLHFELVEMGFSRPSPQYARNPRAVFGLRPQRGAQVSHQPLKKDSCA